MSHEMLGRVALVTGASKGIGAEVAFRLGEAGAKVAVNYLSSERDAARVVARIKAAGSEAVAIQGDVSAPGQPDSIVRAAVAAFGPLDIVVNNAGIYRFQPLDGITEEHFSDHFSLNVLGRLLMAKEAVRHFNPAGGSIVNVSSSASTIRGANSAVYSASCAATDAITTVLAKELAARKIRVNGVAPGQVETEGVIAGGFNKGEFRAWLESVTPMGRVASVSEVASVILFLISDAASYVTGETITIGGGLR